MPDDGCWSRNMWGAKQATRKGAKSFPEPPRLQTAEGWQLQSHPPRGIKWVPLTYPDLRLLAMALRWHTDLCERRSKATAEYDILENAEILFKRSKLAFALDCYAEKLNSEAQAQTSDSTASAGRVYGVTVRQLFGNGMKIPEIVKVTGLSRATVYRHLRIGAQLETTETYSLTDPA